MEARDMSGKKGMPRALTLGGDRYVPALLQVVERRPDGSPETLRLVQDDETVEMKDGLEFLVVYALERCVAPRQ